MTNEHIFVVTEAYVRGEGAAKYVMDKNMSLSEFVEFLEFRQPYTTEEEREHFFDGFWTTYRRN